MIYNGSKEYKIKFYINPVSKNNPVLNYLSNLDIKNRAKALKYIEFLRVNRGILDEPYTRHIKDKVRELRVDLGNNRHRIFFFTFINKNIILLHAFLKKTEKTPLSEIAIATANYFKVVNNPELYED